MQKLTLETNLLHSRFRQTFELVKNDSFCRSYAEEKIHHSLQVIGAGNYLIKHEKTFKNRSESFLLSARRAYLFHDIGRFAEIEQIFHDRSNNLPETMFDHGEEGSRFLAEHPEYNDIRITLPIKHHGHLIADFYNDSEYNQISDETLKEEIRTIIFLVRDADKIANYYLLKHDTKHFAELFYNPDSAPEPLSADYLADFLQCKNLDCRRIVSASDHVLNLLAWIFDLNFKPAFDFLQKTGSIDCMLSRLDAINPDKEAQAAISQTLKKFINSKYQQFQED